MDKRHRKGIGQSLALVALISSFLLSTTLSGCATSERTTRTETTVSHDDDDDHDNVDDGETTRTETRTTTVEDEERGILGTTFHVIGQILAFPFKVVAKIIEAIF